MRIQSYAAYTESRGRDLNVLIMHEELKGRGISSPGVYETFIRAKAVRRASRARLKERSSSEGASVPRRLASQPIFVREPFPRISSAITEHVLKQATGELPGHMHTKSCEDLCTDASAYVARRSTRTYIPPTVDPCRGLEVLLLVLSIRNVA